MPRNIALVLLLTGLCSCSWMPARPAPKPPEDADFITMIEHLAEDIITQLKEYKAYNIAVSDFSDLTGDVSDFGKFIAEELTTKLFTYRDFTVIERQLLNKIIAEQQLSLSGLIDNQDAVSLGKVSGAQALVTGTVTDLGERVKINARLISTETGKIFSAASTIIPKDRQLASLLGQKSQPVLPTAALSLPQPSSERSVMREGILFRWESCRSSGKQLLCVLTVTSTEQDRNFLVFGSSRMFDTLGNQYGNPIRELGNQKSTYPSTPLRAKLIRDIPTRMVLTFSIDGRMPERVALLEISAKGKDLFKVELRDLSVE